MTVRRLRELTDNELVPLCLAEDGDAWEELVRRYRRRVFNIAYQFVGRFDQAEDMTQDLFIKIYGALDRYDTERNFVFWLTRITKNLCIDNFRQRRRENEVFADGEEVLKVAEAGGLDPYARVRRKEKVAFLYRGLQSLTPDLREAVVLRDIKELSYREIADHLGVPEGTVKSRINRGRNDLAKVLLDLENEEGVIRESARAQGARRRSLRRSRAD